MIIGKCLEYFVSTNYSFIQLSAGVDTLELDSTEEFIAIGLLISVSLPFLVSIVAIILIIRRRCSRPVEPTSYDPIYDWKNKDLWYILFLSILSSTLENVLYDLELFDLYNNKTKVIVCDEQIEMICYISIMMHFSKVWMNWSDLTHWELGIVIIK